MGKNPSIIIKEQGAKARTRLEKVGSLDDKISESVLETASKQNGFPCGLYQDLLKAFMIEGYPMIRAEKHIREWAENDLIDVFWVQGYQLVGYGADVF